MRITQWWHSRGGNIVKFIGMPFYIFTFVEIMMVIIIVVPKSVFNLSFHNISGRVLTLILVQIRNIPIIVHHIIIIIKRLQSIVGTVRPHPKQGHYLPFLMFCIKSGNLIVLMYYFPWKKKKKIQIMSMSKEISTISDLS